MSQTVQPPLITTSPEVFTFAVEQRVADYLPEIVEMTRRRFPGAQRLAVRVEDDPEIPKDRHIVLEVDVAGLDPEQYVEADLEWGHELFRICPAPVVCMFRLGLESVDS